MNDILNAWFLETVLGDLATLQRTLTYLLAALVCAYLGSSESLAQRTQPSVQKLWLPLSALYLLAAASALTQGDVLWVQWVRSFTREHHVYDGRRIFQLTSLLTLFLLATVTWKWQQRVNDSFTLRTLLLTGACGTLALHGLRYVSFHYTDLALNAVWLDHSVATWAECACLGLTGAGTGLELLRSYRDV